MNSPTSNSCKLSLNWSRQTKLKEEPKPYKEEKPKQYKEKEP